MFFNRGSNWNIKMELTALDNLSLNTIWDPDFSLDSAFSFVAAGTDAALIYWKKKNIRKKLATTPLIRSVPLMAGKVCPLNNSKYCNQRLFFFSPILQKGWRWIHIIIYRWHNNGNKIHIRRKLTTLFTGEITVPNW